MAEETHEEEFESLLSEEDERPQADPEADGVEESEQGEGENPERAPSLKGRIVRLLYRRRILLCSTCGVLLLAACVTTMTKVGILKITFSSPKTLLQGAEKEIKDDLPGGKDRGMQGGRLEYLSFFIPLPSDSGSRVARVNCSVAWDRLASLHFQRSEVQVRRNLYLYLVKVAERRKVFELKSSLLEAGMGRIIKESLGIRDLEVRLEGIKAF